jgi:hypothetical protein
LRHFQDQQFWDIAVSLIAEDFRQEEDIIENLAGHALFTPSHHHNSLSVQKKRRRIGSPMSAFAQRKRRCSR